jgi:CrcB protein
MNQLIAIAFGGASGAIARFLVATGMYQWLGKSFAYGTLTVNIVGSFLIGLLSEALIVQRVEIGIEYRAAILVGFIGAFTTFSTFALETLNFIEQGNYDKAGLNIVVSVFGCLFAVWVGVLLGRSLFLYSDGLFVWSGWVIPYALLIVNAMGAFLIGLIASVLLHKIALSMEYRAALMVIMTGMFLTFSGLYLILYLIERGLTFETHLNIMLGLFVGNSLFCILIIWAGLLVGKQI